MFLPRTELPPGDPTEDARPHRTAIPHATTVLLVEDEPALLRLTTRTLEREGFTVIPSAGPAAALDLLVRHDGEVRLLLSDVVMPGMSGPELAELVREQRPGIRVLFMSGYPADVVTAKGTLPDSADYLQKPFTAEELLRRVASTMRNPS
jgi:DNA-binding response OmpR family regulator